MCGMLLEVTNVSKRFIPSLSLSDLATLRFTRKPRIDALSNITFSLSKGKIMGILGPNGSGKTTLLKIISTLILPDQGAVRLDNVLLGHNDNLIKARVGFVPSEERSLYWRLTGQQNLELLAALYGLSRSEARARIRALYHEFNVDFENRRFDEYSSGMKKRFLIIKALLHNPDMLLLDEPTKSLDFTTACELRCLIKKKVAGGMTVLLATHDMLEAQEMCDEILILKQGNMFGFGTIDELRKTINDPSSSVADIYNTLTRYHE